MKEKLKNIDDFILNENFQNWVLNSEEFTNQYWQNYIASHPEKIEMINEAKRILKSIHLNNYEVDNQIIDRKFRDIALKVGIAQSSKKFELKKKYLTSVAAAITFILIASLTILLTGNTYDFNYQTGFGEVKNILLPDCTTVTLNGNSELSYNDDWQENGVRKVWIKGEAFFHVKHHPEVYPQFFVNAGDIKVEVTGTKFNMYYRENKKSVVLNEGSLNISSTKNLEALNLQPGEMALYNDKSLALTKVNVEPKTHCSWVKNRLVFDNTPLAEVIKHLENTYGVTVSSSENMQDKRISGTVPSDNLDILLMAIEKSFDFEISKEKNHITIY